MNDMTRTDAVMAVMQVFDRLEAAERRAEVAERKAAAISLGEDAPSGDDGRPEVDRMLDAAVIKAGRKAILKKHIYSWGCVIANRDEDSGDINVMRYERWLQEKVRSIPDYVSRDGFLAYFAQELSEMYEAEKAEAMAELEEGE